jgi:cation diffusion facilitator CzcD-associated flavoprotein CzcO
MTNTSDRYCIIGAGTSGLAVIKNFLAAHVPFDCLEREDTIGGNWAYGKPASSIYQSCHLISSKRLTEYNEFPLPEDYPEFPKHELAFKYIKDYAEHFGLIEHIQFNTPVEWIEPVDVGQWRVKLANGEERIYRGVVIANGHNWDPQFPDFPGEFTGQVFHSCQYKTPDTITGKRVLVVGAGNSGCDLAVEASIYGSRAVQSLRRGYPILPKLFRGMPIDALGERLLRWRVPTPLRRLIARIMVRLSLGPSHLSGWPKADHKLFETHPIINSRIHDRLAHGDLAIKPDIARLDGQTVHFVDGTSEDFDVLIYATGFKISFPFMDTKHLNWRDDRPDLYLNIFHPERDDVFCVGLIQPDSGQWGIVDDQARLVTKYLLDREKTTPAITQFKRLKATNDQRWRRGHFMDSPRHRLEVEHFSYRNELKKRVKGLG